MFLTQYEPHAFFVLTTVDHIFIQAIAICIKKVLGSCYKQTSKIEVAFFILSKVKVRIRKIDFFFVRLLCLISKYRLSILSTEAITLIYSTNLSTLRVADSILERSVSATLTISGSVFFSRALKCLDLFDLSFL